MIVAFSLLIWMHLFVILLAQHYTCPSNKDCIQDCTTSSCVNYIIQAANAATLHVTCSSGHCAGIQISCPYDTTATCEVECTDSNACKDAVINYPQPQNVKLKCSGSSACTGLQLLGPETFSDTTVISSATIQCLGASTCNDATFDLNYAYNVDVLCHYSSTTTSCSGTKIHAKYASDVIISCNYHDCANLYIDATSVTNEITLDCNGEYACGSSSSVHVKQANHFTLKCASSKYSCLSVDIYPNQDNYHANEISCEGTGCYAVSVHVDDDYVLDYLDFTTSTTTINSVRFVCSSRGSSNLFYNTTTQQFECDIKRCCPWIYGDIVCDGNNNDHGDCTINCVDEYGSGGCRNKVIDAVNASTLTVVCNSTNSSYGGCEESVVFCPRNMVHKYGGDYLQCDVKCEDEKACWAAEVYAYDDDELNIWCSNNLSCTLFTVNAVDTKQSNIICTSTDYFAAYDEIAPIQYPYHETYHYFTSFTDNNMDGWECSGNYQYNSCGLSSSDFGSCLVIRSQSSSTNGDYYQQAIKSFNMKYASNIKLDAYIAHYISNYYYWDGNYIANAFIFYNCGSGWIRLEGFCHRKYSDAKACRYTDAGYGTMLHRSYNLPAQCNYNTDVQIKFEAVGSTQSAAFYVKHVTVIGSSDLYVGTCCDIDINAQKNTAFSLRCEGNIACVNNTINVQQAQNVTTTMIGTQSDIKGVINAQSSDVLNVNCGSRYSAHFVDACWKTVFYGNNKSNALKCESYGCNSLNIYSVNGITDWNVTINGCMESQNIQNSVSSWDILCGDDYTSPNSAIFDGNTCSSNECSCNLLYTEQDKITSSYDTIDECRLETPDIICNGDEKDCIIQCTNCSRTAVTGAASKSLTVFCADSCYKSLIYCPFDNKCKVQCDRKENTCDHTEIYGGIHEDVVIECKHNNSCNFVEIYANKSANVDIYCSGYLSCNNISLYAMHLNQSINIFCESLYSCNSNTIYANYANDVTMNCYSNYSCNNLILYGNHIQNLTLNCLTNTACNFLTFYTNYSEIVDIKCYSYSATDASSAACNHLSLYGSHVSSHINWRCFGDYACSHNELHAEHSNYLNLIAYGDRALYYGHIFARNANKYNLSCLSSDENMFTCFSSTMQGPAKDTTYPYGKNSFLDCYGHGCYSLNLDSDSGFDDWSIYFNGCGACDDITSCFDYWYLTCSDLTTLDDHWKLNYYYGDSCKIMTDDDCKCVSYIDKLSQSFVNDYNTNPSFCDFQAPYLSFTDDPTINPSSAPTQNPSKYPSFDPSIIPTKSPSEQMPTSAPTDRPTDGPSYKPSTSPTNAPSYKPSASPSDIPLIPSIFSTSSPTRIIIDVGITSTFNDAVDHTNNEHKMDSHSDQSNNDSLVAVLKHNLVYILIGGSAFVCCILLCCGVFVYVYRKKDKQMQRVLDQLDAQTNDVELADTRTKATKPKRNQFRKKSKNKYEKFTD